MRVTAIFDDKRIVRALLVFPVLLWIAYFFYYSFDLPWFDDFESIPYFLQRFLDTPDWWEKGKALLQPNNEHRVLYARLVVLVYYFLTDRISFLALMIIGNLALIVILWIFYRLLRRAGLPFWYLLPIPFLLFTAQNYLLTFTALYTLQYLAIIMIVMLALERLARNTSNNFWLALALTFFGTFSMGNGMLCWAAGVVVLFYQKQWVRLAIWSFVSLTAIYLYFYGYPVQQGNAEGFSYLLAHPFQVLSGFFVYAGSLFDPMPAWPVEWRMILPLVAGLVMVAYLVFHAIRLLFLESGPPTHWNAAMLGFIVFFLINTALIALFRTRFGYMMVLWSTYRTYILVLSAITYLIFVSNRPANGQNRQRWVLAFLAVAFLINLAAYVTNYSEMTDRRRFMLGQAFNQRYNQIGLGGSHDSKLGDFIEQNMTTMQQRGWYELPVPSMAYDETQLLKPIVGPLTRPSWTVSESESHVDVFSQEERYPPNRDGAIYLILKSERQTYVFFTQKNRPSQRNPLLIRPGFKANVPKSMMAPGKYQLGLYTLITRNKTHLQYTDKVIEIK
ncbi:hypothetical protein GCM10027299_35350 [Larkinella ripae]